VTGCSPVKGPIDELRALGRRCRGGLRSELPRGTRRRRQRSGGRLRAFPRREPGRGSSTQPCRKGVRRRHPRTVNLRRPAVTTW
jgi:hypothetical protein